MSGNGKLGVLGLQIDVCKLLEVFNANPKNLLTPPKLIQSKSSND